MAKRVTSLPEIKSPFQPQYPWDEWMDGSIWEAKQGEDFTTSLQSFAMTVLKKGAATNRKVATRRDTEKNTVTFQFFDETLSRAEVAAVDATNWELRIAESILSEK